MITICILFVYLFSVNATLNSSKVFPKCCPMGRNLIKVSSFEVTTAKYECTKEDNSSPKEFQGVIPNSNIFLYPSVTTNHGITDGCMLQELALSVEDFELTENDNVCFDTIIVTDVKNGTNDSHVEKPVAFKCNGTELISETESELQQVMKCCPIGQVYDSEFHLCRDDIESTSEQWILTQLRTNNANIKILETRLCETEEYAIELKEGHFKFELNGSDLIVHRISGENETIVPEWHWCIDRDYSTGSLVARVCTLNCSDFGAYCMRKCCDEGEFYWRCDSGKSVCQSNATVLFNISSYMEPLGRKYGVGDVIGFRNDVIKCPEGFAPYILSKSSESEWHILSKDGSLISDYTYDYCLETFNNCHGEKYVAAISCHIKYQKNSYLSFVLVTISAAFLALTLVVCCATAERRNLHGLTLICHVSTMLLAFSCLARVQYGLISNPVVCTLTGYFMYFGFVAAFLWLNVMCVDIWWTMCHIRTVQRHQKASATRKKFLKYSLYAWGVSFIFTLVTFLLDKIFPVTPLLKANIGKGYCWFGAAANTKEDWPHYVLFVIPLGLISVVNFVLWVVTVVHCARVKSTMQRLADGSEKDRANRRLYVNKPNLILTGKLGVVMGVTWLMELFSTLVTNPDGSVPWIMYVMDRINELQGCWIFFILIFKPDKIYNFFKKKFDLITPTKTQPDINTQVSTETIQFSTSSIPACPDSISKEE